MVIFRIIGGLGIGLASMAAPTYIAEIAPAERRGILVSFYQLAIVTGFFVVFLATYFIGESFDYEGNISEGWRWMFWSELIPCFLFLGMTLFIPKSPRWLVMSGKENEALAVLLKLHEHDAAQKEIEDIAMAMVGEIMLHCDVPICLEALGILDIYYERIGLMQ